MVAYKREAYLEPDTAPVAFSLALAAKDLALIERLADASATSMPQAAVNLDVIKAAEASVGESADFAGVSTYLRNAAGP